MSIFFYLNKIYIPFYVLFILIAFSLSVISYRRIRNELTRFWFTLFIILRTLLFFLVFSAFFFLVVEFRFSKKEKALIYFLIDSSGSMDIKENGATRKKQSLQILKNKIIPSLGKKTNKKVLLFSDKIYALDDSTKLNKRVTMIGNVLKEVSNIQENPPQAVFLISDGRNNSGEDPVEIASKLSFPVFSIKVGKELEENNIKISAIRVNPIVFKGDSVPVTVVISNIGPIRKNLTIEIKNKDKILNKKIIPLLDSGIDFPVQLIFIPQNPGLENFEIELSSYKDEINKEDNKTNFAVRVLKKRKKVTLLTYQLNWDYRFLRDFLKSQSDIEFWGFARIKENQFLVQQKNGEERGKLNYETILKSDILILIDPEPIQQDLFMQIAKRISRDGMGVLIIGNSLPDFSKFREIYPFITSGKKLSGDFEPSITQKGLASPIFKLNEHTIPSLPPLSNPLRIRTSKPITKVYLEGGKNSSYKVPLFGCINYGKGKVAAFTAKDLWHWKMLPLVTKNKQCVYDKIMNNILKWLAVRKEEKRIMLYMRKSKLLWGEPLTISATLYDDMMQPEEGGIIRLFLKKDNRAVGDFMMKDFGEGNYEKTITNLEPGQYFVQAEVKSPKDVAKKPKLNFEIVPQEIENLNREPDFLLLDNISLASGGKSFNQKGLPNEIKQLKFEPSVTVKGEKIHFAQSFLVLIIISSLFLLELFLRKLKGLK